MVIGLFRGLARESLGVVEVGGGGCPGRGGRVDRRATHTQMKGDRELCMPAVAQMGQALKWASEEMKGDRELCTAAVAQDWQALKWVSEEMKR